MAAFRFDPFNNSQRAYLYMAGSVASRIEAGEFTWQFPARGL